MCSNQTTSINPEFQAFSKKRDIVFFIGAGFSADLGLPAMRDFQTASEAEYVLLSKEDSLIKPAVKLFLDSYKYYKDFREIVKRADKFIKVDPDNIEDIFCIAESFRNSGVLKLPQKLCGEWRHMEDVYSHIGFWLWKIYQQCPPLDERKGKAQVGAIYEDFFCFLKEHLLERMAIITTNYDLVCEYYMNKKQMQICYPISHFADICLCEQNFFYVEANATFDSVPLCKLHGSVNYFENNGSLFISREVAEKYEEIGGSRIPDRRPAMFALDALSEVRAKLNPLKNFEIGVVPPTYSKLDKKIWLRYIWNGAFELIKQAKKIIFIGYSFPNSDGFMKAMLQAALSLKEEGHELEIVLLDKEAEVLRKIKENFFKNFESDNFFEGTFTQVWEKGAFKKKLGGF